RLASGAEPHLPLAAGAAGEVWQGLQGGGRAAVALQELAERHRPDVLRADQPQPVEPLAIAPGFSLGPGHRFKIVTPGGGGQGPWCSHIPLAQLKLSSRPSEQSEREPGSMDGPAPSPTMDPRVKPEGDSCFNVSRLSDTP